MFFGADAKTFQHAWSLRKNLTPAELILWKQLKDRKLFTEKFRRQHPAGCFILDFYCHKYKLGVEIDGEIHANEEIHEYDLDRTAELNKFGIKVLRFTNNEILENINKVILTIKSELRKRNE